MEAHSQSWKLKTLAVAVALIIVIPRAFGVSSESNYPAWTFVRDSAGDVWLITSLGRIGIPIYPASDDEINSIPFTGQWLDQNDRADSVRLADSKPTWADGAVPVAGQIAPAAQSSQAPTTVVQEAQPPVPNMHGKCFQLAVDDATENARAGGTTSAIDAVTRLCERYTTQYGVRGFGCFEWTLGQMRKNAVGIARSGVTDAITPLMRQCLG